MRKFFPFLLLFFLSLSALLKFAQSRIQIEGEDSRANLQGNVQKESEEGEILVSRPELILKYCSAIRNVD